MSHEERATLERFLSDEYHDKPEVFINDCVAIYDATPGVSDWVRFGLWPAQLEALAAIHAHDLTIYLKARQLGASWLVLSYALWLMLFRPRATVLIFSKRDEEAIELLHFRLKGMYERLPDFLRPTAPPVTDAKHGWLLANGSRALSFPTTGGRSYTGTFLIVDEADHIPDLAKLLTAVKPTIDAGGKLCMLSTPDKDKPLSPFKRTYEGAKKGDNSFLPIFHGWRARPSRTDEWYEAQRADVLSRTVALDDLHQEYPATDREALSARTLSKRLPALWLENVYSERAPLPEADTLVAPSIPGLTIWRMPRLGDEFRMGGDPAEGNPQSDESSLDVIDYVTGEQVAQLAGQYEPTVFAGYASAIGRFFNMAPILWERNNHGHTTISHTTGIALLESDTDHRAGWLTTAASKSRMYDTGADAIRQRDCLVHSERTYQQLASIEAATLSAPEQMHDDRATSFLLALLARSMKPPVTKQSNYMTGEGQHYGTEDEEDYEEGRY